MEFGFNISAQTAHRLVHLCHQQHNLSKPNSITLAGSKLVRSRSQTGSKQVRRWSQTCSELKLDLSSSLLAANIARASRSATKFHYAILFEACPKLVADRFEAGRPPALNLSATSFEPSSEPSSVMEFGFYWMQNHGLCH